MNGFQDHPKIVVKGNALIRIVIKAIGSTKISGSPLEFGGGREAVASSSPCGPEAVNATLEDGQLGFEFLEQMMQLVGHFSDRSRQAFSRAAASPGSWPGCHGRCRWGAGDATVGLHQVGQSLIGPVGWVNVGELSDVGV